MSYSKQQSEPFSKNYQQPSYEKKDLILNSESRPNERTPLSQVQEPVNYQRPGQRSDSENNRPTSPYSY